MQRKDRFKIEWIELVFSKNSPEYWNFRTNCNCWMEFFRRSLHHTYKHSHFFLGNSPINKDNCVFLAIFIHIYFYHSQLQTIVSLSTKTLLHQFFILLQFECISLLIYSYFRMCGLDYFPQTWRNFWNRLFPKIKHIWCLL